MTASEPPGPDGLNRRAEERFALLRGLAGEVMVFQPLAICEISAGGLQIETTFPLHLDSLHDFRLTLGTQPIVVKGRVTHCALVDVDQDTVRYRTGVQFVDLPQRTLAVVEGFLDRLRAARQRS